MSIWCENVADKMRFISSENVGLLFSLCLTSNSFSQKTWWGLVIPDTAGNISRPAGCSSCLRARGCQAAVSVTETLV